MFCLICVLQIKFVFHKKQICVLKSKFVFWKANPCFIYFVFAFKKANPCFEKRICVFINANLCFRKANLCFRKTNICFIPHCQFPPGGLKYNFSGVYQTHISCLQWLCYRSLCQPLWRADAADEDELSPPIEEESLSMSAVRGVTATRPLHTVMGGVETDRRPSGVRPESREISFFLYVLARCFRKANPCFERQICVFIKKQIRVLKSKSVFWKANPNSKMNVFLFLDFIFVFWNTNLSFEKQIRILRWMYFYS